MSKTTAWALAGLALGLAGLALARPASADANCEMYAKLAVQQQRENEAGKCELKGEDWSADLKQHLSWCAAASPQ